MGVGGRQVIGTTAAGHLSRLWTALEAEELEAVLIEWVGRRLPLFDNARSFPKIS